MRFLNKKGISIIEYTVLFIIIIGAFLIMKHYIERGFYGTWAKSGQTFAFGRQYDAQKTIECSFDETSNRWYDRNCFAYYNTGYCASTTCPGGICQCVGVTCPDGSRCGCNGDINCQEGVMNNTCQSDSCSQAS